MKDDVEWKQVLMEIAGKKLVDELLDECTYSDECKNSNDKKCKSSCNVNQQTLLASIDNKYYEKIFDKNNNLSFSKSESNKDNNNNEIIFCLKKSFIQTPTLNNIYLKCIIENETLLTYNTHNSKEQFFNLGYYLNKNLLINLKDIDKPFIIKNNIFKIIKNKIQDNQTLNISEIKCIISNNIELSLNKLIGIDPIVLIKINHLR
jgi:hypothetical protein